MNKKITLYTKAKDLTKIMAEFLSLKSRLYLIGCKKVLNGRNISMSLRFVTVAKVRKLITSLKKETSTSVDQLDNYSVKLVSDIIA